MARLERTSTRAKPYCRRRAQTAVLRARAWLRASRRLGLATLAAAAPALGAQIAVAGSTETRSFPWPVALAPAVSSNFYEYREGHIHAGLDVRTRGREGEPCLGVGAGWISRVRASETGYGKAVYVRLCSGETAVYAHLAEFSPPVEAWVRREQGRPGRDRGGMTRAAGRLPAGHLPPPGRPPPMRTSPGSPRPSRRGPAGGSTAWVATGWI